MKTVSKFLATLALLGFASAANAQIWAEAGDAPELPPGQAAVGVGPLTAITGAVSSGTDGDMYSIFIASPALFSASTVGTPGTLGDTQLFLFHPSGMGIAANDDSPLGFTLRSLLPVGNPLYASLTPGVYLLAVSGFDHDPESSGGAIFPDLPFTGVHGPTGPGGGSPVSSWAGASGTGTYTITLTGATFIPGPGALALLGLAGLVGSRRRRN